MRGRASFAHEQSRSSSVKGAKPKKPQLRYEARHALEQLNDHVNAIKRTLGMMSERSLKGLVGMRMRQDVLLPPRVSVSPHPNLVTETGRRSKLL